jgi:PncC family amidohydrolase
LIDETLLEKVTELLKQNKLTVATAESCTGGLIAHSLTNISGSSDYFESGIVSYSNNAKIELLNVSTALIKKYGAVSKQVAEAMVEGVKMNSKVDVGISTTGIAGPTGGTKEKPVGLVYVGVSYNNTIVKKFNFKGNRLENKISTCNAALKILFDMLKN